MQMHECVRDMSKGASADIRFERSNSDPRDLTPIVYEPFWMLMSAM